MARIILTSTIAVIGFLIVQPMNPGLAQAGEKKPAAANAIKLTKAGFDKVKPGMTLVGVMALLGSRAEINPDPAPFAYSTPEVVVVWREGKNKWAGVVFIPGKDQVLRVLNVEKVGGTFKGSAGLTD